MGGWWLLVDRHISTHERVRGTEVDFGGWIVRQVFSCVSGAARSVLGDRRTKALGSWMGGEVNPNCSLPILGALERMKWIG